MRYCCGSMTLAIALSLALTATPAPVAWADSPPLAQVEVAIFAANCGLPLSTAWADPPPLAQASRNLASELPPASRHGGRGTGSGSAAMGGDGSPMTVAAVGLLTTPSGFDWGDAGIGAAGWRRALACARWFCARNVSAGRTPLQGASRDRRATLVSMGARAAGSGITDPPGPRRRPTSALHSCRRRGKRRWSQISPAGYLMPWAGPAPSENVLIRSC